MIIGIGKLDNLTYELNESLISIQAVTLDVSKLAGYDGFYDGYEHEKKIIPLHTCTEEEIGDKFEFANLNFQGKKKCLDQETV